MRTMTMCRIAALVGVGVLSYAAHAQVPGSPGNSYTLTVMEVERQKELAAQRQKKLLEDAQQLLTMAQTLKSSVDSTKKDELSMEVIREADQIEKLAKEVKDRMRQ